MAKYSSLPETETVLFEGTVDRLSKWRPSAKNVEILNRYIVMRSKSYLDAFLTAALTRCWVLPKGHSCFSLVDLQLWERFTFFFFFLKTVLPEHWAKQMLWKGIPAAFQRTLQSTFFWSLLGSSSIYLNSQQFPMEQQAELSYVKG